jgi:hypothetical protein
MRGHPLARLEPSPNLARIRVGCSYSDNRKQASSDAEERARSLHSPVGLAAACAARRTLRWICPCPTGYGFFAGTVTFITDTRRTAFKLVRFPLGCHI